MKPGPTRRTSSGSPVRMTTAGPCGPSWRSCGPSRGAVATRVDRAVVAQHVDRAPMSEAGHEQAHEALERLLAGTRRRQQFACSRQEREPVPADVVDSSHRYLTYRGSVLRSRGYRHRSVLVAAAGGDAPTRVRSGRPHRGALRSRGREASVACRRARQRCGPRSAARRPRRPGDADAALAVLFEDVLPFGQRADHPRFFARIPSPSNYVSVLADMAAAGLNAFAGSWTGGSGPSTVELVVLDWLRELCGMPEGTEGVLVSGGSVGRWSRSRPRGPRTTATGRRRRRWPTSPRRATPRSRARCACSASAPTRSG